jgi:hypothetical protein
MAFFLSFTLLSALGLKAEVLPQAPKPGTTVDAPYQVKWDLKIPLRDGTHLSAKHAPITHGGEAVTIAPGTPLHPSDEIGLVMRQCL